MVGTTRSPGGTEGEQQGEGAGQPVRRRAVAAMALTLVLAFILQDVVVEHYGEPYPGLAMPSFTGSPTGKAVTRREATIEVHFVNGTIEELTPRRLVGRNVPRPSDLVKTMFWADTEKTEAGHYVPDNPGTTEFVRERLTLIYQGWVLAIEELTVTWTGQTVVFDDTPEREKTGVLRVIRVEL